MMHESAELEFASPPLVRTSPFHLGNPIVVMRSLVGRIRTRASRTLAIADAAAAR